MEEKIIATFSYAPFLGSQVIKINIGKKNINKITFSSSAGFEEISEILYEACKNNHVDELIIHGPKTIITKFKENIETKGQTTYNNSFKITLI